MKPIQELFQPATNPVRVVQFGEGNFLRAFVDYAIDVANEETNFRTNVAIILPRAAARPAFSQQHNLYTVCIRGQKDGQLYKENRVIRCIDHVLSAYQDYATFIQLAELDTLQFVISNTTEAGIVFDSADHLNAKPPQTFPAKLTKFLFARYQHFQGAKDRGLIVLPCELIEHNGAALKQCIQKYIHLWSLEDGFVQWLDTACTFADTLVDRIVTGYPKKEIQTYEEELGYHDALLDQCEPFSLWVIGNKNLASTLPLANQKFQVLFTNDIAKYKERKVRILNGAHTSMALGAYLAGFNTVGECMQNKTVRTQLEQTVYEEIVPTVHVPPAEAHAFATATLERFANPFVHHTLLSISLNSIAKWRARVLPTLKDSLSLQHKLPKWLTYSLAALLAFYHTTKKGDGCLLGQREAEVYEIHDDADKLAKLAQWAALSAPEYIGHALRATDWWGEDLTQIKGLEAAVCHHFTQIQKLGAKVYIQKLGTEEA